MRALEKEVARHTAVQDEVEKLRAWKEAKAAELEDLMEKVILMHGVVVVRLEKPCENRG